MSRWFRFYDETINNPKTLRLSDSLYRTWTGLLCVASKNGGTLPAVDDIAIMLRMKPAKVAAVIADLTERELIDEKDGKRTPHNWNKRQYKSDVSTERVKRFRNGNGNVSSTVSETPPETEQKTEKKDGASAPPIDPDADLFRRGKEVLGPDAGSLIAKLKKAKGSIPHARAAIEQASTKHDPREYVGRIINGADQSENSFRENPTGGSLI